jgi:hypothetical protein
MRYMGMRYTVLGRGELACLSGARGVSVHTSQSAMHRKPLTATRIEIASDSFGLAPPNVNQSSCKCVASSTKKQIVHSAEIVLTGHGSE